MVVNYNQRCQKVLHIVCPWFSIQVIGPYRSGKSFLLNQLLSLSCDEGLFFYYLVYSATKLADKYITIAFLTYCLPMKVIFVAGFGVGHMRDTKTKGLNG